MSVVRSGVNGTPTAGSRSSQLQGKSEAAARRLATGRGCTVRVINRQPGQPSVVLTADARPDRVDLRVVDGIVTSAKVY